MDIDYLILGQGICGTFLSYYLQKEGKRVVVIDENQPFSASKVASGVINPVTGRRVVRTWLIEDIMPFAVSAYQEMGEKTGADLIQQHNILNFHSTLQMKKAFENRMPDEKEYLSVPSNVEELQQYFHFSYGASQISPAWLADMQGLIKGWRQYLSDNNMLLNEAFSWNDCTVSEAGVTYKHITAKKIICCEGVAGAQNPYFSLLPYSKNKGEALIMDVPGLPRNNIFKQSLTLVPWKDNLFWVGSPYEWNYSDVRPTATFRIRTQLQLQQWLKLPYCITDHWAAERPANIERRPFVGLHPIHTSVGILNGMGTKGCSLSPFFAYQLTQYLIHNTPIHPHADVRRFEKVLSK